MKSSEQVQPLSDTLPESELNESISDPRTRREEVLAKFKVIVEYDGPDKWSSERIAVRNEILHQITTASKEIHGIKK
jgi:hypothetical protein